MSRLGYELGHNLLGDAQGRRRSRSEGDALRSVVVCVSAGLSFSARVSFTSGFSAVPFFYYVCSGSALWLFSLFLFLCCFSYIYYTLRASIFPEFSVVASLPEHAMFVYSASLASSALPCLPLPASLE